MSAGGLSERRARWVGAFSMLACALALLALLILVRSVFAMTYLNIRFAGDVDPLSRAVSYYVFVENAAQTFDATLVAVAVATVTILAGMAQLKVRLGALAIVLFGVWCVALVLCTLFPTDNSPRVETTSGWIHQFAGASLFATLPLAGLALARSLARQAEWARVARILRGLALGSVVLALGYLVTRLPDLMMWWQFPGPLDWRAISGLIQRALFALELAMLILLAIRLLRVSLARLRAGRSQESREAEVSAP
ncbi:Protein of unknown function [Prauserella marina]|uniref:Uncharacterized protein n=1 Tax=Prauserella marina TaxID=530584 RepID=A0A1G6YID3_9PSEU|nr:DUF998 domain-containing protein [Prauserella marina]PWV71896.1 uncharacterized protein DUF998 [Prauserella marina]SDD90264.1 Protein of unknown function [Prauserella marina]